MSGFERAPHARSFETVGELIAQALARLPPDVVAYLEGGAGTGATVARNRAALDALLLEPRVLRDVAAIDRETVFAGIPLATPVMLAPIGSIALFDPDGAAACARAAHRAGSAAFVGIVASPSLEDVAAASSGPLVFQLYVRGDRGWTRELAERAAAAGYDAICLTVDSPVDGHRERELEHRFDRRAQLARPNLGERYRRRAVQATLTWDDVARLREQIELPLILKGIVAPRDATTAVELGARGIVVSNHGGRQLDHQRGSVEALERVLSAVGDRVDVAVDGGFLRGVDVAKAIALGARAVLVGRLMCWALAAGGEDELVRTLQRLDAELANAMALLGARDLAELTPEHLTRSPTPWLRA